MKNRNAQVQLSPSFEEESRLWAAGYQYVAGIDEAGRGALAGPVVAAAVIPPHAAELSGVWAEVRDSKQLRPKERETLEAKIYDSALAWGVGVVEANMIDEIGIAIATRQAMCDAIAALAQSPEYLLIDWVALPQAGVPFLAVEKADQRWASVAAASILAKVTRDRIMDRIGEQFPIYGFGKHKGYGTAQHLAALREDGPCDEHRHSFAPIYQMATLFDSGSSVAL